MADSQNDKPSKPASSHWPDLMRRAQAGDKRAYARLLHEITPVIRGYLMPRLRDETWVNDVTQDVLMAIHNVRHTYMPAHPFERWMYGIARHKMIDAMRRYQRTTGRETTNPDIFETLPASDSNNPENAGMRTLMQAIAQLPKKQRDILVLTKIKGHSMSETAEQMGMSVAAVKVAAHRAYKELKAILEKDGN